MSKSTQTKLTSFIQKEVKEKREERKIARLKVKSKNLREIILRFD